MRIHDEAAAVVRGCPPLPDEPALAGPREVRRLVLHHAAGPPTIVPVVTIARPARELVGGGEPPDEPPDEPGASGRGGGNDDAGPTGVDWPLVVSLLAYIGLWLLALWAAYWLVVLLVGEGV